MKETVIYRRIDTTAEPFLIKRFMRHLDFLAPGDKAQIEEGDHLTPSFDAAGLIPCISQHAVTGEVLMLGYMNRLALSLTITSGYAHYWSRSRNCLWRKGEQSGQSQLVQGLYIDDDQDCVLLQVILSGGAACHVGYRSCFFRCLRSTDPRAGLKLEFVETAKIYDPVKAYGVPDE